MHVIRKLYFWHSGPPTNVDEIAIRDCVLAKISKYDYVHQAHQVWRWYLYSFFSYDEKCYFSFIKEYREMIWGLPVMSSMTSLPWKYFSLHNLGWSFHFWCQIEAVFNILTFSNWPPFWGRDEIFTGSDTGISICYKDSHEHLWHFELLIDALAQILTELLQFEVLTYF